MTSEDLPIPADLSGQLGVVVTRMRRAMRRSIHDVSPVPLRPVAQVEVLAMIADNGRCRVGDLAARLQLAQSTVSALLSTLIDAGLITRTVEAGDRRAAVVRLTAAGRAQLAAWATAHRLQLEEALSQLDATDRDAVFGALGALSRLVDALERGATSQVVPDRTG